MGTTDHLRPSLATFFVLLTFSSAQPPIAQSAAPPLVLLADGTLEHLLGTDLQVLRDRSGTLTIAQVSSPEGEKRFERVTARRPNLGYTRDAVWFKFVIRNATGAPDWVLNVGREWIEDVTLYRRANGGGWQAIRTGAGLPVAARPLMSEHPALPLRIEPGEEAEFYLRIRSEGGPLSLLMLVSEKSRFEHGEAFERLSYGGFYTAQFVMALYNLILAISLRNPLYALLAAAQSLFTIGEAGAHGHLAFVLAPSKPMLMQHVFIVAILAGAVCAMLLGQGMLKLRRSSPALYRIWVSMTVVGCLVTLAAALTIRAHQAVFWTLGLSAVMFEAIGFKRLLDGDRDGAYYTIAVSCWLIPGTFVVGAILGFIPLFPLSEQGGHVGALAMSVLLSLGVGEQVNRVNRASRLFVPKALLDRLGHASIADVKKGDSIEADMAVLFCDIRRFTARSERWTPAETFAFLNEYLHHVVPAIESNGGLVDKYIGDAVMALFPDSTDDALAAALAMQREVGRMNRTLAPGQEPLAIGIGLHRGRLMLGTVGDSKRLDVTVISDVVNVASRLESLTKEKGVAILVSGEVVASLADPGRFSLEKIGSTTIRGRVQPVEVWAARIPGDSTI